MILLIEVTRIGKFADSRQIHGCQALKMTSNGLKISEGGDKNILELMMMVTL